MAVTYTEHYEVKKAFVEMSLSDGTYQIEYMATSPIDGIPTRVDATVSRMEGDNYTRVGYGDFLNGATSIRFFETSTSIGNQAILGAQFYNDLQSILA